VVKGEHHIIGPPGTGKTTYLTNLAGESVEEVGWDGVMLCSFSKAAAWELAARNEEIPEHMIGTLHSFAYRAIGQPLLVEDRKHIRLWNEEHPALALKHTAGEADLDDDAATMDGGYADENERIFSTYQALRARMVPRQSWPASVLAFAKAWERWKSELGGVDFADMIEIALKDTLYAPNAPRIIIGDEGQDWSALEVALVRKWGERAQRFYIAFDVNQAIYHFKGASPRALLDGTVDPEDPERRRVLPQSYRVPRRVQKVATWWIKRASLYDDSPYRPRQDAEGAVRMLSASWKMPEEVLRDAERYLDAGRSVMLLASCSYMLEPLKAVMRREGIPFGNRYRRKRADWNPLLRGGGKRKTAVDRLMAFLKPDELLWGSEAEMWSAADVQTWLAPLEAKGLLKRGAKSAVFENDPPSVAELMDLFEDPADFEQAWNCNLVWYRKHLLNDDAFAYPMRVVETRGTRALFEEPLITLGTIHSVKGGEADVVYVFPDLSQAGYQEWCLHGEGRDSVFRLFYVAMTRAREVLVLCQQASPLAVDWR